MVLRERLMKKHAGIIIISLILAAMVSMPAGADEVYTYQQEMDGYNGGEDATIASSGTWPTDNPHRLRLRYDGQERYNTLIRFEGLAELEEGRYISGATLTLTYRHENVSWDAATVDIHQCMRSWFDPDWTYADSGSSIEWGTYGAQDPCTDRGELVGTDTDMGPRKGYPDWIQYTDGSKFEFTLDASMVQSWIKQPDTNYGLILIMNHDAATDVTFSSNEDADPCSHPILTITIGTPDYNGDNVVDTLDLISLADDWLKCEDVTTDLTNDGCIDMNDFAVFAAAWMEVTIVADISGNGCVGIEDLAVMAQQWLTCEETNTADLFDGQDGGCVNMLDYAIISQQWGLGLCDGP